MTKQLNDSEITARSAVDNVIQIFTEPFVFDDIYTMIKHEGGVEKTRKRLLDKGLHPAFVRAAIKRVISTRGW